MTIHAHTMTYPAFAASKQPVIDLTGHLIGGPDRKNDDERTKWVAWQKAVKLAGEKLLVTPDVMDYFQKTKHLAHPPKSGDLDVFGKHEIDVPKEDVIKPFKKPRFTWSYTSLQEFLTCPAQWAAKRYFKTIKDVESEAMRWGNIIHATAEHYLKSKLDQPHKLNEINKDALPLVQKYCDAILASGAEIHVEREFCFTEKFVPCGWRDWDTVWVRGKGDVLAKKNEKLLIADWKSGKRKEDFLQLRLFAVLAALTPGFEDVTEFDPRFIFLKEPDPKKAVLRLPEPIKRSELKPVLAEILGHVRRMEEAWRTEVFIARRNGLCKNWCANTDCAHCGG